MRRLPPLGGLRAFEAAARRGSFKLAAAELGVTPTAISHQVRQLETDLDVALFVRRPRRVELTPEGGELYPAMRRALDGMAEAVAALRRPSPRRVATLSAALGFTAKLLVPRAATFPVLHPGWDLRLHASDEPVDLHAGDADAAIRYGLGRYPGLAVEPLLTDGYAPVCSPHAMVHGPGDLAGATLIHYEAMIIDHEWGPTTRGAGTPGWRAWAERAGLDGRLDTRAGITFTDQGGAIMAAIAGQGVALLSLPLVAAELASGALVQPFGPRLDGHRYDLVYPIGAEARPAVEVLRRWVMAVLPVGEAAGLVPAA